MVLTNVGHGRFDLLFDSRRYDALFHRPFFTGQHCTEC